MTLNREMSILLGTRAQLRIPVVRSVEPVDTVLSLERKKRSLEIAILKADDRLKRLQEDLASVLMKLDKPTV